MSWEGETEFRTFNKRLYRAMLRADVSISTLAEQAEISDRQVWSILHGRAVPRVDTIARICRVLGVTIDYLYPTACTRPLVASAT